MKSKNPNRLNIIVISGPSGSGKSTLINRLIEEHDDIVFSTSHTTRQKRENEIDGTHYHFVTEETFGNMIDRDEFRVKKVRLILPVRHEKKKLSTR